MELNEIEVCERIAKLETNMEIVINNQTAINDLAKGIQEMALSIQSIADQTADNNKRLACIEDEKQKKGMSIWSSVVSMAIGFIGSLVFQNLIK